MKKDLLSEYDLSRKDFSVIFEKSRVLKKMMQEGRSYAPLKGKTLGMVFDKTSTRTRVSFEVGMYQLGGLALFLNSRDTQLGRGESIADTARVMSRYLDAIMIRTFSQESLEDYAHYSEIPIINGLTDLLHPCQILSDIFTIIEKRGSFESLKIAYIGDGNNVANSWINAAARLPFHLSLACPEGYDPDPVIVNRAKREAPLGVALLRDPFEAAADADVVYTDVWTSMGQEDQKEERAKVFRNYQVDSRLLKKANPDVMFMHCLPAHRGEEITADVIDGPSSVVMDQAENRLHVQKAILEILILNNRK
jgi:ornithine carbamoyltransferase